MSAPRPTADRPDALRHVERGARLMHLSQRLVGTGFGAAARAARRPHDPFNLADLQSFGEALGALGRHGLRAPHKAAHAHLELWRSTQLLGLQSLWRLCGVEVEPTATPARDDRRFRDPVWRDNPLFDLLKQNYLVLGRWLLESVRSVDDLDPLTARQVEFFVRQVIDALAPTNFAPTNPQALREWLRSEGDSALDGLERLLDDLEASGGRFSVKMTPDDAFRVGENVATTPGKVVFRNELMELIQYAPATETVQRRPLLFIPPWMNKYYVLDLGESSMLRWLVEQGQTVFVISWVNPGKDLAHMSFDDYMLHGPIAALGAIELATGEREVNTVGYCLGGILLAATLAYLEARGDERIRSATLLTTMVDFREAGEVTLFMDEAGIARLEERIERQGFLDGQTVAATFSALRANDLVWSFYVNNYLLGRDPMAFDLLFWNEDSTNMPAAMHTFFMRNMYLDNRLREPGGVTLAGEPIDVTRVRTPTYILSTLEDHISPWRTTYYTTQLFQGPVEFVLGKSGHIAGVINPPQRNKYGFWTGPARPADPQDWLDGAELTDGSWWPHWLAWLEGHGGGEVAAREPGGALTPLGDAPGTYVHMRVEPEAI